MNRNDVLRAWKSILAGHKPLLSIEITRECPLRCPGCYAYDEGHLGGNVLLRQLSDYRGDELVNRVLKLIDELQPLHLSIVGGDPLVRYRELERLLPELDRRGLPVQLVTSAFRQIPPAFAGLRLLDIVVSIDGLQPEHDERRKPATYDRILKNIAGQRITVHCTITAQQVQRPGYIEEFVAFWSARPEIRRIWISLFTPQRGAVAPEILSAAQRQLVIEELVRLRQRFAKLDMKEETIRAFAHPPQSPQECIFAQTTATISADLKTRITPCQFGGDPDCSQCGCVASMALAGLGDKKIGAGVPVRTVFTVSNGIGNVVKKLRAA